MTEVSTASPALIPFTAAFEGTVHRAYRDAGGVVTIGNGFTNLSKTFSAWWKQHHGHALRMGDAISDAECGVLLGKLLAEEYAPPVAKRFAGAGLRQNEFDAATDVSFNCGAGSLKWSWATLLAARAMSSAAARLRVTAVTAGGKRLTGLVRRREDEAGLMESGDYGADRQSAVGNRQSAEEVQACQTQLATLGLYKGTIDGRAGKGSLTEGAVMNFQRANGMVVDGVVGPATRAALTRAVEAKRAGQVVGGGAITGAATGSGADIATQAPQPAPAGTEAIPQIEWHTIMTAAEWGLAIAAALLIAFLIYRNRGVILRRRTVTG